MKAFQDYYPENLAHCFGCGRLNKGRKVVVATTVLAGGVVTARGEVVAVQMSPNFGADDA